VQYDGMTDKNLHITERFTRTSPDSILYRATIDDSTVYTRRWTMEVLLEKSEGSLFEYACHEGNYGWAGGCPGRRAGAGKKSSGT
jgi:hypothetical protein